jgi:two-component system response regulator FlrC
MDERPPDAKTWGAGAAPEERILVVDDDPVSCRLMADVLERAGHRVEWTTAASVALERMNTGRFALVVSDVNMPHMLGTDLCAELRRRDPSLPLLLVSAFADRRAEAEARALGARLLAKPVRSEALVDTVQALLETRSNEEVVP